MLRKEFPDDQSQIQKISELEQDGFSTVLIGNSDHLVGSILFRDSLRKKQQGRKLERRAAQLFKNAFETEV